MINTYAQQTLNTLNSVELKLDASSVLELSKYLNKEKFRLKKLNVPFSEQYQIDKECEQLQKARTSLRLLVENSTEYAQDNYLDGFTFLKKTGIREVTILVTYKATSNSPINATGALKDLSIENLHKVISKEDKNLLTLRFPNLLAWIFCNLTNDVAWKDLFITPDFFANFLRKIAVEPTVTTIDLAEKTLYSLINGGTNYSVNSLTDDVELSDKLYNYITYTDSSHNLLTHNQHTSISVNNKCYDYMNTHGHLNLQPVLIYYYTLLQHLLLEALQAKFAASTDLQLLSVSENTLTLSFPNTLDTQEVISFLQTEPVLPEEWVRGHFDCYDGLEWRNF